MRLLLLLSTCFSLAQAHRLDEYLQATVFSIEHHSIRGHLRLTPGLSVLPIVLASIDTNRDGDVSQAESHNYALRVLGDLRLSVDGQPLELQLASLRFPPRIEIEEGVGEIEIDFIAAAPSRGSHHLTFENHHLRPISVYLANCLKPSDPATQIDQQSRNFAQSEYRLRFTLPQSAFRSEWLMLAALTGLCFFVAIGTRPR